MTFTDLMFRFRALSALLLGSLLGVFLTATCLQAAENGPADVELQKVIRKIESGQRITIACLGDSITAVTIHTGNRMAWPELLDQGLRHLYPRANIKVVNAGNSGNTTGDGLKRIDKDVLSAKPALVIVMLGMNDGPQGEEKSLADMEGIVNKVKAARIPLLVCLQNYANEVAPPHNDARRKLLEKLQVPIADCRTPFKNLYDDGKKNPDKWIEYQILMSDGVHPNLEGERLMTQTIIARLTQKEIPVSTLAGTQPSIPLTLGKGEDLKLGVNITVYGLDSGVVLKAFRKGYSRAKVRIAPRSNMTLTWETIKKKEPALWQESGDDLLMVSVPSETTVPDQEYINDLKGLRLITASKREVILIAGSVLASQPLTTAAAGREDLLRRFAAGLDIGFVQRAAKDNRPPEEIIADWIKQQSLMKRKPKHTR